MPHTLLIMQEAQQSQPFRSSTSSLIPSSYTARVRPPRATYTYSSASERRNLMRVKFAHKRERVRTIPVQLRRNLAAAAISLKFPAGRRRLESCIRSCAEILAPRHRASQEQTAMRYIAAYTAQAGGKPRWNTFDAVSR